MVGTLINSKIALDEVKQNYLDGYKKYKTEILVCGGAGCISSNCATVIEALEKTIEFHNLKDTIKITVTGCIGTCAVGPVILIKPDNIFYTKMTPEKIDEIIKNHIIDGNIMEQYTFYDESLKQYVPNINDIDFFKNQVRITLRNCGQIDYDSIEAYISKDGYFTALKILKELSPEDVIKEIKLSGLRGRGGAGFPTGIKWEAGFNARKGQKYIVCNADEGDPGAFMDRSILEGDPHGVIEGLMIGGYTIGADKGYVYVRAEYPTAIDRLTKAIEKARSVGLLGKNIFDTDFNFDIEIRIGAGAFVCGEETSLIASIEGKRGEPRQKPPFPFESGLFGKPTIINNVETIANIVPIMQNGANWYKQFGTEKSSGTKVFALAGNIVNTGIIEVPMGTKLGDIIYKIGGGIANNKKFKAIQSGGPSGGCLTSKHLNEIVDYESLAAVGAIMGSGGLVVMDENTCMVDTARYFLDFICDESCGNCLPCRVGTKRMLEILNNITEGNGKDGDIELLIELSNTIKMSAMCGLGQTAPNPVLSTIKYFREEYENHVHGNHCEAGVCSNLLTSPCRNACPSGVNVPGYLSLVAAGRILDAYRLVLQDNPFPSVCGRICTHPCEDACRRSQVEEAVSICEIKRFIGDYALRDTLKIKKIEPLKPTGKKVGIVGAGPSGLTCAYYLTLLGHDVEVYEAENTAGGVPYWGIPEFRLPKDVLAKEVKAIEDIGVKINLGVTIGKDISFEQLQNEKHALFIGIGTQLSRKLGIKGEDLAGVISGLQFLRQVSIEDNKDVADEVVIIGGGSTAMDVARTSIRLGSKKVTVIYRRTEEQMLATLEEIEDAKEEGIEIITLVSPVEVLGDGQVVTGIKCVRRELSGFSDDGRRNTKQIVDSEFIIKCNCIVVAINQEVNKDDYDSLEVNKTISNNFDINRFTSQTSKENIFAGGDASPWGDNIVIGAIADGKRAAKNIDVFLGGTGELNKGEEIEIPFIEDTEVIEEHMRFNTKKLEIKNRIDNFDEVELGYHKLDAMAESLRCLHCDRR